MNRCYTVLETEDGRRYIVAEAAFTVDDVLHSGQVNAVYLTEIFGASTLSQAQLLDEPWGPRALIEWRQGIDDVHDELREEDAYRAGCEQVRQFAEAGDAAALDLELADYPRRATIDFWRQSGEDVIA